MSPFAQAVRRFGSRRSVVALIVGGAVAVAVVVPSVSAGPESGAAPAPETGCPNDKALTPINISQVSLPQGQLLIDKQEITPNPVTASTQSVRVRVHITACSGRSVGGALVYAEPTPFEQFSPEEQPTVADGWATLTLTRQQFWPASPRQQLLVIFLRARKGSEDLLGGVSARRLVSFPVEL